MADLVGLQEGLLSQGSRTELLFTQLRTIYSQCQERLNGLEAATISYDHLPNLQERRHGSREDPPWPTTPKESSWPLGDENYRFCKTQAARLSISLLREAGCSKKSDVKSRLPSKTRTPDCYCKQVKEEDVIKAIE